MASFRNNTGDLSATGAGSPRTYAGPSPSGLWLSNGSAGFVSNIGPTSTTPPPVPGTAPGGAGTINQGGGISGLPGTGCRSGNCGM